MGAEFVTETIKAKTAKQVEKAHDELVKQAQYDHGHSGYSGSFAESPGVTVSSLEFDNENDAEEYLSENTEKWENTIAVRIKNTDTWVIGGLFSC